jgi:hypothetical protein
MELLTLLISSLIALVSPVGVVSEHLLARQIRQQFHRVERLDVRIDNVPTYQLLQGRIDQIRLAARGVFPWPDVRLDTVQLETDPISLKGLQAKLAQPLQVGLKLGMTEADVNRALRSPQVSQRLQQLGGTLLAPGDAEQSNRYTLHNPQIDFLGDRRLRLQADLREQGYPDVLRVQAETGLGIVQGRSLQLIDLVITINGQPMPTALIRLISSSLEQQLDLDRLEAAGITARILQLSTDGDRLEVASFVQVRPTSGQGQPQ